MFAVNWAGIATDQLAAILLRELDRSPEEAAAMEAAVLAMNARLAADPFSEGESRAGAYRVAFPRSDLVVTMAVDEVRRVVEVVRVRHRG